MLKTVVFPAPFGPINPVIVPRLIAILMLFTAINPPKRITILLSESIVSFIAFPHY